MMKTQAVLLLVIFGFMLAAGNGLEKSLNEFSKKLQNEIDALKKSITIQDQQLKNISLKNEELQENITKTYKAIQKGTAKLIRIVQTCT